VFEYFKHDRVKVPIGGYRFFIRKRCLDNPDNIFIALVIKWTASSDHRLIKSTLSVEEASRVAETLSIFHARGFQRPVESSREIVNENHDYIKDLMTKQLKTNFDHYLHVLFSHGHAYFSHPDRAYKLVGLNTVLFCIYFRSVNSITRLLLSKTALIVTTEFQKCYVTEIFAVKTCDSITKTN
jgi:hypothetical protein